MHLELLVEDLSTEEALSFLVPAIVGAKHSFQLHSFFGKQDLLGKLRNRLRGYSKWIASDHVIILVIDRDSQDCLELKAHINGVAHDSGLTCKSTALPYNFACRIAVEELEAWFFGDPIAVCEAYPRVPNNFGTKAKFRHPDEISGGTWEELERLLQRAGYYKAGIPKTEVARNIASRMKIERNASQSFQQFVRCLLELTHD